MMPNDSAPPPPPRAPSASDGRAGRDVTEEDVRRALGVWLDADPSIFGEHSVRLGVYGQKLRAILAADRASAPRRTAAGEGEAIDVDAIVDAATRYFRTFGGGDPQRGASWNPVAAALRDTPAQFAAGVDVRAVVEFVLARATTPAEGDPPDP